MFSFQAFYNSKEKVPTTPADRMNSVLMEQANLELGLVNTSSLLTLLECPVCLDHITPPIKQCTKGHLIVPKRPLVSAHMSGSLVSSGDLPLELFMKMAHAALDLIEPAALKALGVHTLLSVG